MKKVVLYILIFAIFVSCSKDNRSIDKVDMVLTKAQAEYVFAGNDLGFKLFKALDNVDTESKLLSPLCVQSVLSMLVAGADGNTADEIVSVMGFGDDAKETVSYLSSLTRQMKLLDRKTDFSIANAMLVNSASGAKIMSSYTDVLSLYQDANVFSYDFISEKEKASEAINKWTSDHTSGIIPSLIGSPSELLPTYVAVLWSALLFKSSWALPFNPQLTVNQEFFPYQRVSTYIPMMHQTAMFDYYEDSEKQALTMKYGNGAYCFTAILPRGDFSLSDLVEVIDGEIFREIKQKSVQTNVNVCIPSFIKEMDLDLKPLLKFSGINEAFSGDANFGKLAEPATGIHISKTMQKTYIRVNESGSEAASATRIDLDVAGSPDESSNSSKVFNANHPFLYLISESSSSSVIFIGSFTGTDM